MQSVTSLNPTTPLINTEQGQYVDGLRAPLVIHPSTEVHSYDVEYTVILGDWYHNEHSTLLNRFISVSNPRGGEPVPGQPDKFLSSSDSIAQSSLRIGRLGIDLLCSEWLLPRPNFRDKTFFRNFPCRVQRERDFAI